jgi:hypothetical protein
MKHLSLAVTENTVVANKNVTTAKAGLFSNQDEIAQAYASIRRSDIEKALGLQEGDVIENGPHFLLGWTIKFPKNFQSHQRIYDLITELEGNRDTCCYYKGCTEPMFPESFYQPMLKIRDPKIQLKFYQYVKEKIDNKIDTRYDYRT